MIYQSVLHAWLLKHVVDDHCCHSGVNAGDHDMPPVALQHQIVPPESVGDHSVLDAKQSSTGGEKVERLLKEVKAHLVCVEHAPQQIILTPERAKDLQGGKGRVQKETHLGHGNAAGQKRRHDQQTKTLNPHHIALVEALQDHLGNLLVDGCVGGPELDLATAVTVNEKGNVVQVKFSELRNVGGGIVRATDQSVLKRAAAV